MAVGPATRLLEFIQDQIKSYRAEITLGISTATHDLDGEILSRQGEPQITKAEIENLLERFRGKIRQIPPLFSALHHKGERLYRLARRQPERRTDAADAVGRSATEELQKVAIAIKPREVEIFSLRCLQYFPPKIVLELDCTPGTYVRALARDIGESLGCGAVLSSLIRTRSGPFFLEESVTGEQLEQMLREKRRSELLLSPIQVLRGIQPVTLNEKEKEAVTHGRPVPMRENSFQASATDLQGERVVLLLDRNQDLLAVGKVIGKAETRMIQPVKVLTQP